MKARPRSRFENEDGSINLALVGEVPEYPQAVAWDKEYEDECDRLAELEAIKTGRKHWGRWYLTKTSLMTRTSRPKIGARGFSRGGYYDIGLDRLGEDWVGHMKEKNWMGEKGLRDLGRAISALSEDTIEERLLPRAY